MQPLVSVVVPAYNSMQFLPRTIKSVRDQTFENFEILVVDDGSSDGTRNYICNYPDARLIPIVQENCGVSSARNAGIKASRGKYVALLDADDLWRPQKLERQVRQMEADPEIGLTHTGISYIDEYSQEFQPSLGVSGQGMIRKTMLIKRPIRCGSTSLIRRSCFDQVGLFSEDLPCQEDWDMWLRISEKFKIAVINEPLTQYRQHRDNMTKRFLDIMPASRTVIERAFERMPERNITLKPRTYGSAYMFAAWRAFYVNERRVARRFQQSAWSSWPPMAFSHSSMKLILKLLFA
jgi:glycosyltransferase involved in cell wall biosynthesis